jgi:D-galactarolactone isomerase
MIFPAGACDTHMHFYDAHYPASSAATLFPPDASVDAYQALQRELGLERVVIVQPSTYGLDNACQIDAAASFGRDARVVVVVDEHTPDTELRRLDELGARGARFHMLPGGALGWESLEPTAHRIADLGWHIQLQMDGNLLPERLDTLHSLPVPLVIDHVGRFMPPPPPDSAAFAALLVLVDTGRCWVKLSAPYESTGAVTPSYPTVTTLVDRLVDHAPERLLWATNWPHPGQTEPPTAAHIRDLTETWIPDDARRRMILTDNPAILYGFEQPAPTKEPT